MKKKHWALALWPEVGWGRWTVLNVQSATPTKKMTLTSYNKKQYKTMLGMYRCWVKVIVTIIISEVTLACQQLRAYFTPAPANFILLNFPVWHWSLWVSSRLEKLQQKANRTGLGQGKFTRSAYHISTHYSHIFHFFLRLDKGNKEKEK